MIRLLLLASALALLLLSTPIAFAAGDPAKGAQVFAACAACHSVEPGRDMTGPSLAGISGRMAGSLASFQRYSPELAASHLTWDSATLDRWLAAPAPADLLPHRALFRRAWSLHRLFRAVHPRLHFH